MVGFCRGTACRARNKLKEEAPRPPSEQRPAVGKGEKA